MSKPHKDLPAGSQPWANEVDALMAEVAALKAVVKRLSENAGLDFANPQRGVNTGNTPSIKNPVGQKLSSLADVQTYNVLDEQVLSWSQQGQRWLPVTLPTPSAGGTIDISEVSYSGLEQGYGVVTSPTEYTYTAAGLVDNAFGPDYYYTESWTTGTAYWGAGNWDEGPGYAMIEADIDGFDRPFIRSTAEDYVDGTWGYTILSSYKFLFEGVVVVLDRCLTADRPTWLGTGDSERGAMVFDVDLNIPIMWNGTIWTNLIGTAV